MEEVTKYFEQRIKEYVEQEMKNDDLFRQTVEAKPDKSVEEACRYIIAQVNEAKRCGWDDSEIFAMVKHYYDENDIEVPEDASGVQRIVVGGKIDLTDEERREAKEEAVRQYKADIERKERERREAEEQKERERKEALKARRMQENQMQGDLFGGLL